MPTFAATLPLSMVSPPLLLLLLLLLLPSFLTGGAPDLDGDAAALLAFRSSVGRSVLQWNATASPYSWRGVYRSGLRVTAVRLPAAGLRGAIPAGTIGNLTALRVLSLRLNALSGPLPPDISNLQYLRSLYLQGNHFSGELPGELFSLSGLSELDLAENDFSGGISRLFNNLTRLRSLFLQNNRLSGELPNINLPRLIRFNVSYNKLTGSVPPGLRSMPATSFLGMPLCDGPFPACATENPPSPRPSNPPVPIGTLPSSGAGGGGGIKKQKLPGGAIAVIAVGCAAGILILAGLLIVCCTRSKGGDRKKSSSEGGNGEKRLVLYGAMAEEFDLEELLNASAEFLGSGRHGTSYKTVMEDDTTVAVKRLRDVKLEEWEFKERIKALSSVRHENVVRLLASYWSQSDKVVIYDYLPRGSLFSLLHGPDSATLDWSKRCSIALAAARGIQCIHSSGTDSSHGNVKSSNILLCSSNHARISDHGLYQLSSFVLPEYVNGYRAPEVTDAREVSQSADVFSFGVVLLELVTGRVPLVTDGAPDLPRLLRSVPPERRPRLLDPQLMMCQNAKERMLQVLHLAMDCTVLHPCKRPSMSVVVARLEQIIGRGRQHQSSAEIDYADD